VTQFPSGVDAPPVQRALRALVARGEPAPAALRERVAWAARQGEVVLLAREADPALAPWLDEPARRHVLIDGHLELMLALAAEALARVPCGRVALLKGSAAARLVYARPGLRFRRDVDLLAEDVPAVRAALVAAGFVDRVDPARRAAGPAATRTWPMARATPFGEVELDLHRALVEAPWCAPSVPALLADAVASSPLPVTSVADTLVHTAIHLAENGFRQPLKAWVDVDRLARAADVATLAARAELHGGAVALVATLEVAARWFDTPVAAHVAALGRPWGAAALGVWLGGEGALPHRPALSRAPARHLARLLAAPDAGRRLAYLRWLARHASPGTAPR